MLAKHKLISLATTLALLAIVSFARNCDAQVRRYQPSRPTTSPYLNLTRLNVSAVPNYYSLVRPAQRQQVLNQQEQALRMQQAGSLQRLQNDVQRGLQPATGTGKRSGFMTSGSRATFNSTNRFFQTNAVRLGR